MITSIQRRYIKKWIIAVAAELIMFIFNGSLPFIYPVIAVLFFGGFILRVLRIHPKWILFSLSQGVCYNTFDGEGEWPKRKY